MPIEKVNILLVDDQPGKLMSYEVILGDLNENLLKATSAAEALQILLKNEIAVLLVDVCMPDLDGFELAAMIREHPRFEKTAIIFVSAVLLSEGDSLKGYELGGVDYVPVPVIPAVLRAKVGVFVDLYRKSTQLERLNRELEHRVAARTDELQASIKHQELLAREVDHRAKNALAVVQAIVRLTKGTDVHAFSAAVHGRIRAIANAHTLLSESRWIGADILKLVREELAPYQDGERVSILGSSVDLPPDAAQSVAIVLHELATNAAKYGALSRPEGRLTVSWNVVDDRLNLTWVELGGPVVSRPETDGFGTKVINASVTGQLKGDVAFDWRPSGLHCHISIPRSARYKLLERQSPGTSSETDAGKPSRPDGLRGLRVMLVEDDALIAMMMTEILVEEGVTVVGPFSTLADSMACRDPIDAALLDINLANEPVYPLAEKLKLASVPIVFLTGYDESTVDDRFTEIVLHKPIDPKALSAALLTAIVGPTIETRGALPLGGRSRTAHSLP